MVIWTTFEVFSLYCKNRTQQVINECIDLILLRIKQHFSSVTSFAVLENITTANLFANKKALRSVA